MNRIRQTIACAALALLVGTVGASAQQVTERKNDPFYQWFIPQSQAFGLEMLGARIAVAEAYPAPVPAGLVAELDKMAIKDIHRFLATLQQKNAGLATQLKSAVDDVMKAVKAGQSAAAAAARAKPLVAQAYNVVIEPTLQANTAFRAGVLTNVLMAEDGVSEGFEEAVKPTGPWQYPTSWAAYVRTLALWKDLQPLAKGDTLTEGNLLIDNMKHFYTAGAQPKLPLPVEDQEELEALAGGMINVLEALADAHLFTGRDLPKHAQFLADTLAPACTDFQAGRDALALERVYAVADQFTSETAGIAGAIVVLAPDTDGRAKALFPRLIVTRYTAAPDKINRAMPAAEACRGLVTVMNETKKAVGG